MHKKESKIDWNTKVVYPSKQAFIDAHKDAYPDTDLGAEFDKHFAKAEKPKAEVK